MKVVVGPLSDVKRVKTQINAEIDTALEAGRLVQVVICDPKRTRSSSQNALQFQWYMDAEAQGDTTAKDWRAYCKLTFGVPILRMEDDEFREVYDEIIRPLEYEQRLRLMLEPIDLPVTSRMTVKQKTAYLDDVYQFFTAMGFELTDPDEKREAVSGHS